jgi:signal transduction histidine kinase/ligand-binding sensor domain-containing protein
MSQAPGLFSAADTRTKRFSKEAWRMRQLWRLLAGSVFLAVGAANAGDMDWSVRVWQSDDGLPNNNVTGLAQTRDGYLWVATSGHFARFDGVQIEELTSKNTLPASMGYTERGGGLLVDSKGRLWTAMVHGPVVCLNAEQTQVFTNNLPNYVVQNMVEDGEGGIWLTYHGNVVCRIKGGVTRFTEQDGLPARFDCALTSDKEGRIWFAKDGQLGVFGNGRFEVLNRTLGRSVRLAGASAGGIWVCSGRELFSCDNSGVLKSAGLFKADLSGTTPTCMFEDKSGAVWIGTAGDGLFRYSGSGFESIPTSHPYISSLLQDLEGNIWAGTGGGGLDRIRPRAFTMEDKAAGLPFGAVESVCEDAQGNIWATTQNGVLACRTNGRWRTVSDGPDWPVTTKAMCVAADRQGAVWVGTRSRVLICLRDGHLTTWRAESGFPGHVVRSLLVDSNDDLWVVEEDPNVLQRIHAGQFTTLPLPSAAGVPRALCADASGALWVGTSKGLLLRIQHELVTDETANVSGVSSSIRSLAGTPDGSLWIGYAGWGVGRFKDGRFTRITSAQGLFNDDISQVISDERGWLWFGSDRGIFKARLRELHDLAEGRAARIITIQYGKGNAVPSLQASFGVSPNVALSRNGRLWFPALTGLAVVNLNNLQEHSRPPPVLLKQVKLDDVLIASYGGVMPVEKVIDLREGQTELRLPPGHRRLEFDFTAFCLSAPENVRFQYRLSGIDDDWGDDGPQRSISYSRLPAGSYEFQVRAQNGDSAWSEPAGVGLIVRPFFWQTWWLRSIVLAVFTLSVIAVVRYVSFRRLRTRLRAVEQQAALDKERSRIARDIHDNVGGSLTQIKLLFELTQRNRAKPDKVDSLGQEGLSATRQIIKSMDEIVWAVNPSYDSLPHLIDYIGQFAIEFLAHADIRCRVDLPDRPVEWAVSPETRHNLFLAVKEALNNVILHAGAKEVWLRVTATEKILTIAIEDDGCGFAPGTKREFADGLSNLDQRMTEIGGQSSIDSKVETGTRVSLIFPRPDSQ